MELGKIFFKIKNTKDMKEITIFVDGDINIQTYLRKDYKKKLWYEWKDSRNAPEIEEALVKEEMMPYIKGMFEYYNSELIKDGEQPIDYETLLTKKENGEDIDLSYIG